MKRRTEELTVVKSTTVERDGALFCYSLIKKSSGHVSSFGIPLYSIQIELTDSEGRKTEACAGDVFVDIGKALVFFDRMVKNLATPIDLAYVIEDELR
ncbi:MAG: hypothetical protein IJW48_03910 [Clostridia bacterium]|nr:hypothetical protein [Clostridia bacterium]